MSVHILKPTVIQAVGQPPKTIEEFRWPSQLADGWCGANRVNALVTGGGGFLGLYVVEQLVARGDRVRVMCRKDCPPLDALGVETVCADLRDRQAVVAACRGVDAVFHVGGIAGMVGPWKQFFETNALGTRHVVEGCLTHGVRRLVYTSSPSVTFDGRHQCGVDESIPYPKRWLCHYAHSKALAEQHVLAANGRAGLADLRAAAASDLGAARPALDSARARLAPAAASCAASATGTNLIDTAVRRKRRGGPSAGGRRAGGRARRWPAEPISSARASRSTAGRGSTSCWRWPVCRRCGKSISLRAAWTIRRRPTRRPTSSVAPARPAADEPIPGRRRWPRRTTSTSAAPAAISATSRTSRPPKACGGSRPRG